MIPRFRDHAANERTYLAWIRTAIATLTLAFLVEKFDLFLHMVLPQGKTPPDPGGRGGHWIGLGLALLALTAVVVSTVRFYRHRRLIDAPDARPDGSFADDLLLGVVTAGLFVLLIGYLLLRIP